MLGDIALAINPKDERYFHLIGKNAILPIIEKEIPIVVDSRVDPKFGTGILKITPAHSLIDYEIGIRHQLPMISVIDENAKMNENAYEFQGLDYLSAREKIVSKLKELGLIEKIEKIKHNLPFCDRCKSEIQVIPSKEWFLKMKNLADLALKAIKNKEVEIYPTRFKKVSFDWLKNIRDWCISRKLWWGQQIPVWYCKKCGEECFIVSQKKPKTKCLKCKKQNWQRTEEVFDTWFSSALWPFAILYTKYEKKFYPSDLVATAREILQLWIMRMIFSGKFFMGKEPFKFVFIHPTVLTKEGKRMSKSLGTGIDPLELIEKYGTDALRFGILWQMSAHQDLRFDLVPVEQGQKFLNKIWNAYRFYFLNKNLVGFKQDRISRFRSDKSGSYPGNLSGNYPGKSNKNPRLSSYDKKILRSLESTKKFVSKKIENYEMGLALKRIYKFFWNELCDVYLESWKGHPAPEHSTVRGSPESVLRSGSGRAKNNPEVFTKVMLDTLKLMHPFLPYITQFIYFNFKKGSNCLFFEKW
jgi:valyl-tRNA synthetase